MEDVSFSSSDNGLFIPRVMAYIYEIPIIQTFLLPNFPKFQENFLKIPVTLENNRPR